MRRAIVYVMIGLCILSFAAVGCAKKAASSQEAIQTSEVMKTAQEKTDYLTGQAKAFYNSKDYQDAVQTAQYVLSNLDKNSQAAQNIIADAKAKITAAANTAAQDMKKQFGIK